MPQRCDSKLQKTETDANSRGPRATGTAVPETAALFLPRSQMFDGNAHRPPEPLRVRPLSAPFSALSPLDSSLSNLSLIQTAASAISMTTTSVYTPFAPFMGAAAASPAAPPRRTPGILTTLL